MKSFEHRSRNNRFLLCFRALPMAAFLKPDRSRSRRSNDQALYCTATADKDPHAAVSPDHDHDVCHHKNRRFSRHLSKVFKSALFETSLVARIRKSRKKSPQPVTYLDTDRFCNLMRDNLRASESYYGARDGWTSPAALKPQRSVSTGNLPRASSCARIASSPTKSSLSISKPMNATSLNKSTTQRNMATPIQKCASYYTVLCLLLVSLFALVIWGRVCAIFCASTWLFLRPRCYNHEGGLLLHHHIEPQPAHGKPPPTPPPQHVDHHMVDQETAVMDSVERNRRRSTSHTASFFTKF